MDKVNLADEFALFDDRWAPRGVEHCPAAEEEAHLLLFEPASTLNSGDAGGVRTAEARWI